MAFRSPLLTLFAAALLFLGACTARSIPTRRSPVSLSSFDHVLNSVEIWTRRVHDSGSDSDDASNSSTSTTSSSTTNSNNDNSDDDNDATSSRSSTSTSDTCLKTKNVSRIIQNDDGYGSYYSSGIGRHVIGLQPLLGLSLGALDTC
ncbi:uncharacterized protein BDW70DRAFT_138309 [Aspergillus foveolatus]|uniref:uncharacterized protein n=1 Tax=Aspergillus foveolatus TaxID=210207 RepID=UPI003CCE2269